MKSVNIIGLGYGGYSAPVGDGDRWTLNTGFIYPDIDRLFLMHDAELNKAINLRADGSIIDMVAYLKKNPDMDVVGLQSHYIEDVKQLYPYFNFSNEHKGEVVRAVKKYPVEKIAKMLGGMMFPYTVCYMIALAIFEGYERITLYGFEINSYPQNKNYPGQEESLIWFDGFCRGRGIALNISNMAIVQSRQKNTMYGYFK